jgi:hypothetical protein
MKTMLKRGYFIGSKSGMKNMRVISAFILSAALFSGIANAQAAGKDEPDKQESKVFKFKDQNLSHVSEDAAPAFKPLVLKSQKSAEFSGFLKALKSESNNEITPEYKAFLRERDKLAKTGRLATNPYLDPSSNYLADARIDSADPKIEMPTPHSAE